MSGSWVDTLADYCPTARLWSEEDAERWEHEIDRIVGWTTEGEEISDAIRWARTTIDKYRDPGNGPPSVAEVAAWVKKWAKHRRDLQTRLGRRKIIEEMTARMEQSTPEQRFEILCECDDWRIAATLEGRAKTMPGGYVRPKNITEMYRGLMEEMKHLCVSSATNIPHSFRLLKSGEIIREGDKYFKDGNWYEYDEDKIGTRIVLYANTVAITAEPK